MALLSKPSSAARTAVLYITVGALMVVWTGVWYAYLRNYPPEFRERESREDIPVGEYGQPEDLANLVCFLASPRARYITGTVIPVDGGLRRYQF